MNNTNSVANTNKSTNTNTSEGSSRWGKPPPGYIPGLDRGAVGFLTRSDLGNARNFADSKLNIGSRIPNRGNSNNQSSAVDPLKSNPESSKNDDDEDDFQPYDQWNGNENGLFSNQDENLDEEDREAENVYDQIDRYLEQKREKQRTMTNVKVIEDYKKSTQTIRGMFSDLKKDLLKVKKEEWNNIPNIENYTIKKKKIERYSVVPDHVIQSGITDSRLLNSIEVNTKNGSGTITTLNSLNDVSQAKNSVLSIAMDKLSGGANSIINTGSGNKSINPVGYITELTGINLKSDSDIDDIKKVRKILNAVINADMMSALGYICLARVEELDGKAVKAREILKNALEQIKDSEDLWLEAVRMFPPKEAKKYVELGLAYLSKSPKLWIACAELQTSLLDKVEKYELALKHLPSNEEIWKKLVSCVKEDEATNYLKRAVEHTPQSLDLWLAYAKLSDYKNAKVIINNALKNIKDKLVIYIAAIRLEETNYIVTNGDVEIFNEKNEKMKNTTSMNFTLENTKVERDIYKNKNEEDIKLFNKLKGIIKHAHRTLKNHGIEPSRESYLTEAENCEKTKCFLCCEAIISETLSRDNELETNERFDMWKVLIDKAVNNKNFYTARAIYKELLLLGEDLNLNIWLSFLELEKKFGSLSTQECLLKQGIDKYPGFEELWLMFAKFLYKDKKNLDEAHDLLNQALLNLPNSEEITLGIVKVLTEKAVNKEIFSYISKDEILNVYENKKEEIWLKLNSSELILEGRNILSNFINKRSEIFTNDICLNKGEISFKFLMKFIQLDRLCGKYDEVIKKCEKIIAYCAKNKDKEELTDSNLMKIWLIFAECYLEKPVKEIDKAIITYKKAFSFNNKYPLFAVLESRLNIKNARAILDNAKGINPNSELLVKEQILLEVRLSNKNVKSQANIILESALKIFSESGELRAIQIALEPVHTRESKAVDLSELLKNNQYIYLAIGKIYFNLNKEVEKTITILQTLVSKINPDFGDGWIHLYLACFAARVKLVGEKNIKIEEEEILKEVERRCNKASPTHGDLWTSYSKKPFNWFIEPGFILRQTLKDRETIWLRFP